MVARLLELTSSQERLLVAQLRDSHDITSANLYWHVLAGVLHGDLTRTQDGPEQSQVSPASIPADSPAEGVHSGEAHSYYLSFRCIRSRSMSSTLSVVRTVFSCAFRLKS